MQKILTLRWLDGPAKAYTDEFPLELFRRDTKGAALLHSVNGPKGGRHKARFRLTVGGRTAVIDYRPFRRTNEAKGMEVGVLAFDFVNRTRTRVASASWNGERLSEDYAAIAVVEAEKAPSYADTVRRMRLARVLARPEQAAFRQSLDVAYGGACCVSGCTAAAALQAAHIAPFAGLKPSDAVTNGLLLRADLHALFDADELAIDPGSGLVYVSAEARSSPEYALLHGRATLSGPATGHAAAAPSRTALRHRWQTFVRVHGKPR